MADVASLSLDEIIKKKKIKPFKKQNNSGIGGTVKRLGNNQPQKKNIITTKNKIVTDARNKIIQGKKQKIGDAREKLGQLARQGDARDRLNRLKKGKQGIGAIKPGIGSIKPGGKAGLTSSSKKAAMAALAKQQQNVKKITTQGKNINRTVSTASRNVPRNQNYQQRPQNMRPQQVQYQTRPMRPEPIYESYPQEEYVYPEDMYDSYPQPQVIYRQPRPAPVVVRPAPRPVYRPAPVYIDEYDSPAPIRETVYVDERGVPVRTRQVYADAPMRRPAPAVRVERQQSMSSRMTQQRPVQKQQVRPQQQQARPQQQGQKVLVNNLASSVTAADMKEIFGTIGKVSSSRLIKKGVAEAVFLKKQDAAKFVEAFHNRLLDGQAMNAYLVKSR